MNIVIYSNGAQSELVELIELNDEDEIRQFDVSEIENYKQYNPALLILDMEEDKIREFCAVRKLECCVLAPVKEIPESLIIRALSHDFIKLPANKKELNTRVAALLKTAEIKKNLIKTAICDELTGLYNRRQFEIGLEQELNRTKRHPSDFSLAILDIDFFKKVNPHAIDKNIT